MDSARQSRLLVSALGAAAMFALAGYGYSNKTRLDEQDHRHAVRLANEQMAESVSAAALRQDTTVVRAMLQRPDASAETVGPAVIAAAGEGSAAMVALLLDSCPAARQPEVLDRALMRAAGSGYADVAHALLARGARPDLRDGVGFPLIVRAASRGHAEVVRALLDAGADVNAAVQPDDSFINPFPSQDYAGTTPLLAAAARGNPPTVRLLLRRGADVAQRTADAQTALGLCRTGRVFWTGKRGGGVGVVDIPSRAIAERQRVAKETNCLEVEEMLRAAGCTEASPPP